MYKDNGTEKWIFKRWHQVAAPEGYSPIGRMGSPPQIYVPRKDDVIGWLSSYFVNRDLGNIKGQVDVFEYHDALEEFGIKHRLGTDIKLSGRGDARTALKEKLRKLPGNVLVHRIYLPIMVEREFPPIGKPEDCMSPESFREKMEEYRRTTGITGEQGPKETAKRPAGNWIDDLEMVDESDMPF